MFVDLIVRSTSLFVAPLGSTCSFTAHSQLTLATRLAIHSMSGVNILSKIWRNDRVHLSRYGGTSLFSCLVGSGLTWRTDWAYWVYLLGRHVLGGIVPGGIGGISVRGNDEEHFGDSIEG